MSVAIVTGGTRGIGAALSHTLIKLGHTVIANYVSNDDQARHFAEKHHAHVMKWDVSDFESCHTHVEKIKQQFGRIDILINNAGVTRDKMLHKMGHSDWAHVLETNLTSAFNMTRCVINDMRDQNYGRIINISSVNAKKGQVGQANYAAAKSGLIGFTKAVALENAGKGITANVVAPGYIATEMVSAIPQATLDTIVAQIPVKRLGDVEDIAHVLEFLVSPRASYITGATIDVNGGFYMH